MARFERWLEVKRIFEEALEVAPEERQAFLERACADDEELRGEVESLLNAPPVPTSALAVLLGLPGRRDDPNYAEGDRIDHFVVVGRIGAGGMGAVYEARDTKNNDRRVAVKVLFSRAVTLSQDKRLAGLSHPSIVTFHDSGETSEGLPYFVFEFIEGEPITAYCECRKLDMPERLRLFLKVCEAVAYAHQRLVIHCDLKPENILVTATGELKLLDFGIAKEVGAASSAAGDPSPLTLPFASPEQVGNEETTTLSDVYSLGVLLAVLLTGRLPYAHAETIAKLRDAILHEEALAPSRLVAARGRRLPADTPPSYSSPPPARSPARLVRRLRGDLDAIVGRALQKSPSSRYHSPQELSADVERHLAHYPIASRRGLFYRVGKGFRRHWRPALVAAIILPILSFFGARWYRAHLDELAESARATELDTFLHRAVILYNPENISRYEGVLQDTVDEVLSDIKQPVVQIDLLNALGVAYQNAKIFDGARRCHKSALKIAETKVGRNSIEVADTLGYLGTLARIQNDYPRAEEILSRSFSIRAARVPETDYALTFTLYQIAALRAFEDRDTEADSLHRRTLLLRERALLEMGDDDSNNIALEAFAQSLTALGAVWADRYKSLDRAEWLLRLSLRLRLRFYAPSEPRIGNTLAGIASVLEKEGQLEEAERLRRQAAAIYHARYSPLDPETIVGDDALGRLLLMEGKQSEAETLLADTLQRAKARIGTADPRTIRVGVDLARARLALGRPAEADALLKEASGWAAGNPRAGTAILALVVATQAQSAEREQDAAGAAAHARRAAEMILGAKYASSDLTLETAAALGGLLTRLRLFSDAEALLLDVYHRAPWRPDTLNALVNFYSSRNDPKRASTFRQALQKFSARYHVPLPS